MKMAQFVRMPVPSPNFLRSSPISCCHANECTGPRKFVLAIDVGTGGTKAALVSSSGDVFSSGFSVHPPPMASTTGDSLSMEQDQEVWWKATIEAIRNCMMSKDACARDICAVAVTGQMQNVIIIPKVNSNKKMKAILYSDVRAVKEANEVNQLAGGSLSLASTVGSMQGASSILAKLRWLDKHDSEAACGCERLLLGGHDYVVWKLCNVCVSDATTASTTGLVDQTFQYAGHVIEKVGLGHWMDKFPQLYASDMPCGEISDEAAKEIGFAELNGVPVLHCCGDAGACTLGAGAAETGSMYAYLGTSGWVAGSFGRQSKEVNMNLQAGVFRLAHPDSRLIFKTGSIMTAGGNLAWAAKSLGNYSSYEDIDKHAMSVAVGCGGLLYLPFINGERCPVDDPNARASFIGISSSTMLSHMFRAVMEGVALALRSSREAMGEGKGNEKDAPLRLVGGGAKSLIWPQIVAGVFGQPVEVLENSQDVGVKGAALLAGKWLGWHASLSPEGNWLRVRERVHPLASDVVAYDSLYTTYDQCWKSLQHTFQALSLHRL